jgi:hypothetical protein
LGFLVNRLLRAATAACCSALVATGAGAGADDRGVHGSVGLSVQHDRNLFRLPEGATPASAGLAVGEDAGTERGDRAQVPEADLTATLALGRQRLAARLNEQRRRYARYDAYDTREGGAGLRWRWALGNDWSGELASERSRRATELVDYRGRERNVVEQRSTQVAARWSPHPALRLGLSSDRVQGRNTQPERNTSDYDARVDTLEARWFSGLGNSLTLRLRDGVGEYPNRVIVENVPVDNSWRQRDVEVGLGFQPGGRTRGEVRLGRGQRRHDEVQARDFSGSTGRVAMSWDASAAWSIDVEWLRDLAAVEDFDRLYAVTQRRALGISWVPAAQWQAQLRWGERRVRYGGDPSNVLTNLFGQAEARDDRLRDARAILVWRPTRDLSLQFDALREARQSNRVGFNYTNRGLSLGTRWLF